MDKQIILEAIEAAISWIQEIPIEIREEAETSIEWDFPSKQLLEAKKELMRE